MRRSSSSGRSTRIGASAGWLIVDGARLITLVVLAAVATGCATAERPDPFEKVNRRIFAFNEGLDRYALEPVAKAWDFVIPGFVQDGIQNFYRNLDMPIVVANDLLQAKPVAVVEDVARFFFNSTLGLGGFIDVATRVGIPDNDEDFGQTLGYWGVGEGYYLVLPVFGPSTTRDVWGVPVDSFLLDPVTYVDPLSVRLSIRGTDVVDKRANLLRLEKAFGEAQVDPYSFQRQAYLQRRRELTYDGNPPRPKLEFEEPEAPAPPAQ